MNVPNAGWFPDPMGRHELRYWSGNEWSEHVSDAGTTGLDPVSAAPEHPIPQHGSGHEFPPPTPTSATPTPGPLPSVSGLPPVTMPAKHGVATWKIVSAIAAVASVIVGGVFVVRGGGDDAADVAGNAAEVFLEPAVAVGTDPFTSSVDTNTAPPPVRIEPTSTIPATTTLPAPTSTTTTAPTAVTPVPTVAVSTTSPATIPTVAPAGTGTRSVNAAAPGLYGGTRNNASCDQEQMISFLTDNADKAAAWAGVQGIAVADIPAYIRALTPLVLRADTRVTNYGYRNGRAYAKPAVLQMGTAVLIDQYGIPRARCSCGNPLAPPQPQPEGYVYRGDRWPGFDPRTVIVVVNVTNVVINEFVVVDLGGGYFGRTPPKVSPTGMIADGDIYVDTLCDLFPDAPECRPPVVTLPTVPETVPTVPETVPVTQPEPVLGTGDIQFTLRWGSTADLDLAVLDPNGEEISFSTPLSTSGGQLDVDSNADCAGAVTNPVENIFWPTGQSPIGVYRVAVRYYAECGAGVGPQPFTLTVLIDGVEVALQPEVAAISRIGDQVSAPGESRQYSVDKSAAAPITVPPTVAPTAPPTAPPTTLPPVTTPPTTVRVPVTTLQPVGAPPSTERPGQTVSLEDYCQKLYGPGAVVGPGNPMFTLCMHDPTVT